jgi:pimeloyl-ACP methyl ester carboxylesterase
LLPKYATERDATGISRGIFWHKQQVTGDGSPVVLIGGAFNDRTTTAGLARVLAPYYRAVTYDRRGRGESGDESVDYSVGREMEDLRQ